MTNNIFTPIKMKIESEFNEMNGQWVFTYTFINRTTNQLNLTEIRKLNELITHFTEFGHDRIENQIIVSQAKEIQELLKRLEKHEN